MSNNYIDIVYRYIKYKEYIIKISLKSYYDIYDEKSVIDKNNARYYQTINFFVDNIEHIVTKLSIYEINMETNYGNYILEINKNYEKSITYFRTYERAFIEDFIKEKQYLLFNNEYSGNFIDYYDNGQIKETYFHTNGIINGIYKSYYENLNNNDKSNYIHIECNYINGKKYGEYKKYFYYGKLNIYANYYDDKLIGDYKVYNKNNILTYLAKYNNDNLISFSVFHPISGGKIKYD